MTLMKIVGLPRVITLQSLGGSKIDNQLPL